MLPVYTFEVHITVSNGNNIECSTKNAFVAMGRQQCFLCTLLRYISLSTMETTLSVPPKILLLQWEGNNASCLHF